MDVIEGAAAAARAQLRMADDSETATLTRMAATACTVAEAFLGIALAAAPREDAVVADGAWQRLRRTPVRGISGVRAGGIALPAERYAIDIDAAGDGWVRVSPCAGADVTATYEAGLAAEWEALPAPIAQGVAMLAAHLFDDCDAGATPPAAVSALWRPFRRMRLGEARR